MHVRCKVMGMCEWRYLWNSHEGIRHLVLRTVLAEHQELNLGPLQEQWLPQSSLQSSKNIFQGESQIYLCNFIWVTSKRWWPCDQVLALLRSLIFNDVHPTYSLYYSHRKLSFLPTTPIHCSHLQL